MGPKTRDCLRTSQWSLPLPYCTSKFKSFPPFLGDVRFWELPEARTVLHGDRSQRRVKRWIYVLWGQKYVPPLMAGRKEQKQE